MPAAGAVTNLTAGIFEGAQFEAKLRYGDASDTVPTHFTLPLTIATLAQFGRHAILYRFHDEASDAITVSVLFEDDAAETVLEFVDRCVDASEEIVGTVIYEVEE